MSFQIGLIIGPIHELVHEPATILLQLKLTKEKKDQVMKLVFGDKDIELL